MKVHMVKSMDGMTLDIARKEALEIRRKTPTQRRFREIVIAILITFALVIGIALGIRFLGTLL